MSSDVQAFQNRIFASDFEFSIAVNEYYSSLMFQLKFGSPYCCPFITLQGVN